MLGSQGADKQNGGVGEVMGGEGMYLIPVFGVVSKRMFLIALLNLCHSS